MTVLILFLVIAAVITNIDTSKPVPVRPAKAPPKAKDPYAERRYGSVKYLEDM